MQPLAQPKKAQLINKLSKPSSSQAKKKNKQFHVGCGDE
jgi:hypothetical protein